MVVTTTVLAVIAFSHHNSNGTDYNGPACCRPMFSRSGALRRSVSRTTVALLHWLVPHVVGASVVNAAVVDTVFVHCMSLGATLLIFAAEAVGRGFLVSAARSHVGETYGITRCCVPGDGLLGSRPGTQRPARFGHLACGGLDERGCIFNPVLWYSGDCLPGSRPGTHHLARIGSLACGELAPATVLRRRRIPQSNADGVQWLRFSVR